MGLWRFWPFPSALLINGAYGLVLAFIGGNLWKSERFGASPSPSLSFMRISTAMNHLARFERRLEAIYRNAALCKQPHAELLEEMKALWADHAKARLPGWCASKLVTRRDILAQKHYDHLIWAFKATNGQIKPYEKLSDSDRKLVHNGTIEGKHYYMHSITTKTVSECGTELYRTTKQTITDCAF
jgi:hypothetical protein